MAIRLITGVPGSGKSFYMVNYLETNYFKWDENLDNYVPKDPNLTLVTNLENLKLPHQSLDEWIEKSGLKVEEFFTWEYQEKIQKKYPRLVYCIDECQRHFNIQLKDQKVFFYFQKHRHLGHDVFLLTQSPKLLATSIRELVEIEIHALPRSISFFGFIYNIKASGINIGRKFLKKKGKIFALYSSFKVAESEKTKNPIIKQIIIAACIVMFFGYLMSQSKLYKGKAEASQKKNEKKNEKVIKKTYNANTKKLENERGKKETKKKISKEKYLKNMTIGMGWHKLNAVKIGNDIHVLDPQSGDLIPLMMLDIPYRVVTISNQLKVYAEYEIEEKKDDFENEKENESDENIKLAKKEKKDDEETMEE